MREAAGGEEGKKCGGGWDKNKTGCEQNRKRGGGDGV